jgi:hypothetical protein
MMGADDDYDYSAATQEAQSYDYSAAQSEEKDVYQAYQSQRRAPPHAPPPRPSKSPTRTPPKPETAGTRRASSAADPLHDLEQLEELHEEAERMKALGNKHMAAQVSMSMLLHEFIFRFRQHPHFSPIFIHRSIHVPTMHIQLRCNFPQ